MTLAEFEDRLCQNLPSGHCRDEAGQPTLDPGSTSLGLMDVVSGTGHLLTWWLKGSKRVGDDEITRRSYICNGCPMHRQILGCQSCSGAPLRAIINRIIGGRSLGTDTMLGACGVCRCSLVAKTRMAKDDIVSQMPKAQYDQLWTKCWIKEV
jgi:hypothetical protein